MRKQLLPTSISSLLPRKLDKDYEASVVLQSGAIIFNFEKGFLLCMILYVLFLRPSSVFECIVAPRS
jgi:hypothetical protein